MGNWVFVALFACCANTLRDIYNRKTAISQGPYAAMFRMMAAVVPILAVWWGFQGFPLPTPRYWMLALLGMPFECLGQALYFRALREGDASLLLPLTATTPVFILGGNLLYHENGLTSHGVAGVIITGVGALLLVSKGANPLSPFIELRRNNGARLMLSAAAVFGITNLLLKAATLESPVSFCFLGWYALLLPSAWLLAKREKGTVNTVSDSAAATPRKRLPELVAGLFGAASVLCTAQALSIAPAAYVNSVKRLSILLIVIYGGAFLKEGHFTRRLVAALMMVAGSVMMAKGG